MGKQVKSGATAGDAPDLYDQALDWEASRISLAEESKNRAWKWAWAALFGMLLSWVAIVLMMPLKETVPYVIRVDNATGVPDIMTTLNTETAKFDEVMDKYWLARYVRARETYDWYTLQDDYNTVGLLSSDAIGKVYGAQFGGDNGKEVKNADRLRTTVQVLSVVPSGNGSATVRFRTRTLGTKGDVGPGKVEGWVATIGYEYKSPSLMRESYRLVNPFGFQVMSYRVDPEAIGGGQ